MKLSIITVTWNSAEHILSQMRSVEEAAIGLEYEHIIVDNGSYDDTVLTIREHYPKVRLIRNKQNRGFAAANNSGYTASRGEFVLFLNPDTLLVPKTLSWWIQELESRSQAVIAGPLLLNEAGETNKEALPRAFPTLLNQSVALTWLRRLFPAVVARYRMHGFEDRRTQRVDSVRGACMLVRRSFLDELGYAFDPRYFIWFEDVDLCKEARYRGYEVWYMPHITAIDLVGRSFAKRSAWWKRKHFIRSLCVYLWKWKWRS